MPDFEVIVIGLGPAGATVARHLAAAGVKTLGVEKETLPRYKVCGGAVSRRARELLDLDITGVTRAKLHRVEVEYQGKRLSHTSPTAIAFLTDRSEFDSHLVDQAIAAGAQIQDGTRVERIEDNGRGVTVHTSADSLSAEVVVVATGARTPWPNWGLSTPMLGAALEGEAPYMPENLDLTGGEARIGFASPRTGYSWVFHKGDHLSFGVCSLAKGKADLRGPYEDLVCSLGLEAGQFTTAAHPIPLGGVNLQVTKGRIVTVGDAAGLADPLSGEGIASAIHSGTFAAEEIVSSLSTGDFSFTTYNRKVQEQITTPLQIGRKIAHLLHTWPGGFFRLLESSPALLELYFRLVQGDVSYDNVWRDLHKLRRAT